MSLTKDQIRAPFKARGLRVRIDMGLQYAVEIIPLFQAKASYTINLHKDGRVTIYIDHGGRSPAELKEAAAQMILIAEACAELQALAQVR